MITMHKNLIIKKTSEIVEFMAYFSQKSFAHVENYLNSYNSSRKFEKKRQK
jgi:hypothetical protein